MKVDERARAGMFLAMQYPVEAPGVSVSNFLRSAATAVRGEAPRLRIRLKEVRQAMERLHIDPSFAERNYTRILRYVHPDHVHVFAEGRIIESGGP